MLASLSTALKSSKSTLHYSRHSRGFLPRFKSWMVSDERAHGDHELMVSAFIASKGTLLTQASKMVADSQEAPRLPDQQSSIGLIRGSRSYNAALNELRSQGFTILPWLLPECTVDELSECIQRCRGRFLGDEIGGGADSLRVIQNEHFVSPRAEKFAICTEDLLQCGSATELAMDPGVLALAQDYLEAIPQLDIFTSWFSFPVGRSSNEAATQFHYDLDRTKWLKIFFFLTDVDAETGAHVFVPTTHRDGGIPRSLLSRGYSRISDEQMVRHFPRTDWKSIEGPRGSILIEDTRGLHKGAPLLRGHRLLLQFQYSQNLFGSPSLLSQVARPDCLVDTQLPPRFRDTVLAAFRHG